MTTLLEDAQIKLAEAQVREAESQTALHRHELGHKEASDKSRIYHFPSVIVPETVETCIEVIQHWLDIDADKDITVAFNSPGGHVFPGFALYDFINDHVEAGAPIDVTGYGFIASMATVDLQAGRTRSLHSNAVLMIHEVSTFAQGNLQSLRDHMEFVEKVQKRSETILVGRANGDAIIADVPGQWETARDALHQKTLNYDWWMTAEEALAFGFIDCIAK